uniref:Uncharacterized protein n=1 Tax=Glossina brevipalpis TaxID=37001 RepID=A0A1A9W8T5_9MUSC
MYISSVGTEVLVWACFTISLPFHLSYKIVYQRHLLGTMRLPKTIGTTGLPVLFSTLPLRASIEKFSAMGAAPLKTIRLNCGIVINLQPKDKRDIIVTVRPITPLGKPVVPDEKGLKSSKKSIAPSGNDSSGVIRMQAIGMFFLADLQAFDKIEKPLQVPIINFALLNNSCREISSIEKASKS